MYSYYAGLALDLANERTREAGRHYRSRIATTEPPSVVRRTLARLLAANGRTSMSIARRLDSIAAK